MVITTLILFSGIAWLLTKEIILIESWSMQHSEEPQSGVIDIGDHVLVDPIDGRGDLTTYFEGKKKGYKTNGEYGDVIAYEKYRVFSIEMERSKPVIHRIILWLEFDETTGYFSIPELNLYNLSGSVTVTDNFPAYAIGDKDGPLVLKLDSILAGMAGDPHSGFITKGDYNPVDRIDQYSISQPVKIEWIIGRAEVLDSAKFILIGLGLDTCLGLDIVALVLFVQKRKKDRQGPVPVGVPVKPGQMRISRPPLRRY
jgi:signal peptidase I